jgi:hypothetical protein
MNSAGWLLHILKFLQKFLNVTPDASGFLGIRRTKKNPRALIL